MGISTWPCSRWCKSRTPEGTAEEGASTASLWPARRSWPHSCLLAKAGLPGPGRRRDRACTWDSRDEASSPGLEMERSNCAQVLHYITGLVWAWAPCCMHVDVQHMHTPAPARFLSHDPLYHESVIAAALFFFLCTMSCWRETTDVCQTVLCFMYASLPWMGDVFMRTILIALLHDTCLPSRLVGLGIEVCHASCCICSSNHINYYVASRAPMDQPVSSPKGN